MHPLRDVCGTVRTSCGSSSLLCPFRPSECLVPPSLLCGPVLAQGLALSVPTFSVSQTSKSIIKIKIIFLKFFISKELLRRGESRAVLRDTRRREVPSPSSRCPSRGVPGPAAFPVPTTGDFPDAAVHPPPSRFTPPSPTCVRPCPTCVPFVSRLCPALCLTCVPTCVPPVLHPVSPLSPTQRPALCPDVVFRGVWG